MYVEGGGSQDRTLRACKNAFGAFFQKLLGGSPKPKVVACGARDDAYRDFCLSRRTDPDTFAILLVDSEDPVPTGKTRTAHLKDRERHWTEPMPEEQVHLMVQCMESWFLADVGAMEAYYEQGFRRNALPQNPKIEEIPRQDVLAGLDNATGATTKGTYHKTRHGFEMLARLNPEKVRDRSPHAEALFMLLCEKLT